VRQHRDIARGKFQGIVALDGEADFALLNHVDAGGTLLEFDVEAGSKFGRQQPLAVELNEPENVGEQIDLRLRIGRWGKNSVVGVMGFHGERPILQPKRVREQGRRILEFGSRDTNPEVHSPRQLKRHLKRTATCRNAGHPRTRVGQLIRNQLCEIFSSQPLPRFLPERH
jgi:hypothetical protein